MVLYIAYRGVRQEVHQAKAQEGQGDVQLVQLVRLEKSRIAEGKMPGAEIGDGRHGGVHEHGQIDAFSPEKESQAANGQ